MNLFLFEMEGFIPPMFFCLLLADCCILPRHNSSCLLSHSLAMPSFPPSPPDSKASLPSTFLAKFVTSSHHPDVTPDESLPSNDCLAASIALALSSLLTPASSVKPGLSAKAVPSADTPCVSICLGLGLCAGHCSVVVRY